MKQKILIELKSLHFVCVLLAIFVLLRSIGQHMQIFDQIWDPIHVIFVHRNPIPGSSKGNVIGLRERSTCSP